MPGDDLVDPFSEKAAVERCVRGDCVLVRWLTGREEVPPPLPVVLFALGGCLRAPTP